MRALCVVMLVGCSGNRAEGTVNGGPVDLLDAYFVAADNVYEGGDGVIIVRMSGVKDLCRTEDTLNQLGVLAEGDTEHFAEAWASAYPPEFWDLELRMRVASVGEELKQSGFQGMAWDETSALQFDPGEVSGTLTHYRQWLDADYFAGIEDPGDYLEYWPTDGGEMMVDRYVPLGKIKGRFDTVAYDWLDGDPAGELSISFKAKHCPEMVSWYFGDL